MTAAITFLLVHSLYKSALFLVVGIIDHETGTREVNRIGGLIRAMPVTGYGAATAAMSMAGFPLFLGFIGKEIMYKGALTEDMFPAFATTAAVVSNALMTAVAGAILIRPFFGRERATPRPAHEARVSMWLGPAAIGSLGLFFGIIPDWVGRWLVQPAVVAIHPDMELIRLNLFHGFNEPLLLSFLTLLLGSVFYFARRPVRRKVSALAAAMPVTGQGLYILAMAGLVNFSKTIASGIQGGSLYRYLWTIILTFTAAVAGVWIWHGDGFHGLEPLPSLPMSLWLLAALTGCASGVVVAARSRILAVCALGIVGAGAALIFLVHGAPDVALTQLLVETLTLIIASIVLLRLPPLNTTVRPAVPRRWLDAMLAIGTGTLVTALTLAATHGSLDRQLTTFFEDNSYLAAHGRNIVNVILVDFRSLDTLGEIVVVATAGLAGFSLISKKRR